MTTNHRQEFLDMPIPARSEAHEATIMMGADQVRHIGELRAQIDEAATDLADFQSRLEDDPNNDRLERSITVTRMQLEELGDALAGAEQLTRYLRYATALLDGLEVTRAEEPTHDQS